METVVTLRNQSDAQARRKFVVPLSRLTENRWFHTPPSTVQLCPERQTVERFDSAPHIQISYVLCITHRTSLWVAAKCYGSTSCLLVIAGRRRGCKPLPSWVRFLPLAPGFIRAFVRPLVEPPGCLVTTNLITTKGLSWVNGLRSSSHRTKMEATTATNPIQRKICTL